MVEKICKNNVPVRNHYLDNTELKFIANVFGFSSKPESTAMTKTVFS